MKKIAFILISIIWFISFTSTLFATNDYDGDLSSNLQWQIDNLIETKIESKKDRLWLDRYSSYVSRILWKLEDIYEIYIDKDNISESKRTRILNIVWYFIFELKELSLEVEDELFIFNLNWWLTDSDFDNVTPDEWTDNTSWWSSSSSSTSSWWWEDNTTTNSNNKICSFKIWEINWPEYPWSSATNKSTESECLSLCDNRNLLHNVNWNHDAEHFIRSCKYDNQVIKEYKKQYTDSQVGNSLIFEVNNGNYDLTLWDTIDVYIKFTHWDHLFDYCAMTQYTNEWWSFSFYSKELDNNTPSIISNTKRSQFFSNIKSFGVWCIKRKEGWSGGVLVYEKEINVNVVEPDISTQDSASTTTSTSGSSTSNTGCAGITIDWYSLPSAWLYSVKDREKTSWNITYKQTFKCEWWVWIKRWEETTIGWGVTCPSWYTLSWSNCMRNGRWELTSSESGINKYNYIYKLHWRLWDLEWLQYRYNEYLSKGDSFVVTALNNWLNSVTNFDTAMCYWNDIYVNGISWLQYCKKR